MGKPKATDEKVGLSGEARARKKLGKLWEAGRLFHNFWRYPRNAAAPRVDRLAGILRNGLVAPALCKDGSIRSDLHITVKGSAVPYESVVFLHRYGPRSGLYTMYEPGRMAVFVDSGTPVLTPKELGRQWVVLCRDEVYVRNQVEVARLIGVAVHSDDVDSVVAEHLPEFERVGVPLYLFDGTVVWPRRRSSRGSR